MLKTLKFLVLLATVSCGYTSDLNNISKDNNSNGKFICNIINNFCNNNCNIINDIINNNNINITNKLGNSNSYILNNINNVLTKKNDINNKIFSTKKRKREQYNSYKETINNNNKDNNNKELEDTKKYYNNLFGNNYNNSYYYESIKQYINNNEKSNDYITDAYKMFAIFAKNVKHTIYDYHFNNECKDNINLVLNDLKRYAMLFDKFKFKKKVKNSYNNSISYLNKYIKMQTKYSISIEEFYNYIVNKTAKLYDQTINALNKSIKQNEPSDKQNEIIKNAREVLDFIITSFGNTNRDLNDKSTNHKVSLCDKDRTWVIVSQLEVDEYFINLEKNLIKKFNEYNNKLMLFLDKIINTDKNKNIVINGVNDTIIRNNISVLLEKLNIENCSNYKEIKDFFTNSSLKLNTKEYFKLFAQYSNNLKDILIDKINKTQSSINDTNSFELLIKKNSFDSFVFPYIKIIKDTLKNITINNSIVYDNNDTLKIYNFDYLSKLSIYYFL